METALLLLHSVLLLGQVITGRVSADALEHAIVTHPKSHYALHLGMLLRRFGFLLATFTQERKHQLIKRFFNPRRHTPGLERGVLEELTLQHVYELKDLICRALDWHPQRNGQPLRWHYLTPRMRTSWFQALPE